MSDDVLVGPDPDDPRIVCITLRREERRNAMSASMVAGLLAVLEDIAAHATARVVVLAGAGRGFCAGSDLAGLAAMDSGGRRLFEENSGRLARTISAHPLPILAAVHGFAIGGGLTLAAACDIVVTTPDAKWSLPEVPIGLFPAWGLEWVCDRVGRPMARRLAWGIDTLDGNAAREAGLADIMTLAPMDTARALAKRLADLPRMQSAAVKSYFAILRHGAAADEAANDTFMSACGSPEAVDCLASFLPKT